MHCNAWQCSSTHLRVLQLLHVSTGNKKQFKWKSVSPPAPSSTPTVKVMSGCCHYPSSNEEGTYCTCAAGCGPWKSHVQCHHHQGVSAFLNIVNIKIGKTHYCKYRKTSHFKKCSTDCLWQRWSAVVLNAGIHVMYCTWDTARSFEREILHTVLCTFSQK